MVVIVRTLCLLVAAWSAQAAGVRIAVLISADAEWKAVRPRFPNSPAEHSPYGEFFYAQIAAERVLFFHGGWGKVSAAASTQYVIDRFKPARLINLGTCGGIEGRVRKFEVIAAEKVIIYDIYEAMGDSAEAVAYYATTLELPTKLPTPAIRTTIYSADRDLTAAGLRDMDARYHPSAVDWESGAIAWVAKRNATPLVILRGVTDLVSPQTSEAAGNFALFESNAARVMEGLLQNLPKWITAPAAAR